MKIAQTLAIIGMALYWLAVKPLAAYSGMLIGALFPVVSSATLIEARPSPPPSYRHVWSAEAVKHFDCQFIEIEWFVGKRDGRAAFASAEFLDPPQVREPGLLHWDGLAVSLDPDEVLTNSYAYVWHKCDWWPWQIRSLFWDSALEVTK